MKGHLLFILLILSSIHCKVHAQSREVTPLPSGIQQSSNGANERFFVVKIGIGAPQGEFAQRDLQDPKSGFANVGLLLEGSYQYFLTKSVYLGAMTRFQFNNIEDDIFIENRRSQVPSSVSVTFDSKPWTNTSLMGGFGTETPIDPQTKIVTRFMAGVSFSSSASFESILTDGITTIEENQSKVSTSEFSYAIGLGLKMEVSSGTTLVISGDYFASEPSFEDVEFTATQNGMIAFRDVFSFTQKIELINFSIGFAFKL